MKIFEYDSFTKVPGLGNPAGIVNLHNEKLSEDQMQQIALASDFNETVFISRSSEGQFSFRFFTPGHEINLCGHATVAGVGFLFDNDMIELGELEIDTKTGKIVIKLQKNEFGEITVIMRQNNVIFEKFSGNKIELCFALGIEIDDLDENLDVVYGNTGTWTLLVPVKSEAILKKMIPSNHDFPDVLKEIPNSSIHPYTIEKFSDGLIKARHFSSPYSKTIEDPVTGTASGVIGEYLLRFFANQNAINFVVEQGEFVNRPGIVHVHSQKNKCVEICGTYIKNGFKEIRLTTASS